VELQPSDSSRVPEMTMQKVVTITSEGTAMGEENTK